MVLKGRMNYQDIITIEEGKRGGRPCVCGLRITVADVLVGWRRVFRTDRFSPTILN